jgi:hypothetical protein
MKRRSCDTFALERVKRCVVGYWIRCIFWFCCGDCCLCWVVVRRCLYRTVEVEEIATFCFPPFLMNLHNQFSKFECWNFLWFRCCYVPLFRCTVESWDWTSWGFSSSKGLHDSWIFPSLQNKKIKIFD